MVSVTRNKILLMGMLFGVFCAAALGGMYGGRTAARGTNEGMHTRQDPRQQQQQAQQEKQARLHEMITQAATNIDTILKDVLTRINDRQIPEPALLTDAEAAMKESGGYMSRVDKSAQCQYFMLQSWVSYFKDDLPQAMMASLKAYGLDEDNHDAYVTQATMAFFADRTPIIKKPQPQRAMPAADPMINDPYNRRRQPIVRQRPTEMVRNETVTVTTSSGNILQYDPDSIVTALLGKSLPAMQMQCMDSSTIAYNATSDTLCALLWQAGIEPANAARPGEPNNVPPQMNPTLTGNPRGMDPTRPQIMTGRPSRDGYYEDPRAGRGSASSGGGYYDERMMSPADMYGPMVGSTAARPTLTSETEAFSALFQEYNSRPGVKFIGLNTDAPTAQRQVMQQILTHPWPWAHVSAMHPLSGTTAIAQLLDSPTIDKTRPILIVADGTGTIKYAGPATGFVAPMFLERIIGGGAAGISASPSSLSSNPLTQLLQGLGGTGSTSPVQETMPAPMPNQTTTGNPKQGLVGQKIGPLQLHGINSTDLSYQPGSDTLCVLVWQMGIRPTGSSEPNVAPSLAGMTPRTELAHPAEPNRVPPAAAGRSGRSSPSATARSSETARRTETARRSEPESYRDQRERDIQSQDPRIARDPRNPGGIRPDYYDGGAYPEREFARTAIPAEPAKPTIESETAAFTNLYAAYFDRPGVKFVAINTDDPAVRRQILERMLKHPWPWTQVIGKDPASGAGSVMQFLQSAQVDFSEPFLLIIDTTGTVKYKGQASGDKASQLLAQMEQSGAIPAQTVSSNMSGAPNPFMQLIQNIGDTAATPTAPPKPNPIIPPRRTGIPQTQLTDPDENFIEDPSLFDAGKKLEFARTFVSIGRKRMMTSKQGVDACREILQRWPNTKYAEEARQLLRLVPENERKKYNITNEELGL
ncbi:MAG: hypothetical protein JW828_02230 [Sedimentisphaerales bacterium]|nr:hypothetical protein [Sedimentisphaerales bacterium]